MGIHAHQVQVMCTATPDNDAPGGGVCGWQLDKGTHVENQRINSSKAVVKTPLVCKRVRNQVLLPARVKGRFLYHGAIARAYSPGCVCMIDE